MMIDIKTEDRANDKQPHDDGSIHAGQRAGGKTCACVHDDGSILAEQVAAAMPDGETTQRLSEFFKLLGDPTRLRVLLALGGGELCVTDIAAALSMERTAISHQLRVLRSARLVRARRDGKMILYSFDDAHVDGVIKLAEEHMRHD